MFYTKIDKACIYGFQILILKLCIFCLHHLNDAHRPFYAFVPFYFLSWQYLLFNISGIMQKSKGDLISVLKAEREELESSLSKEKLHTLQLKQELADAESSNSDLYKVTTFTVKIPFLFWI